MICTSLVYMHVFFISYDHIDVCVYMYPCKTMFVSNYYTPGIYAEGYIAFALTFVRSYVRSFVSSCVRSFVTFRHVRRIYHKVFG